MAQLQEDHFGFHTDEKTGESVSVRSFTWRSDSGVVAQIITYGATITSIKLPNRLGEVDDIILGYDDMKGYLSKNNPYFGATVGRVANRIGNARFSIGDTTYNVSANLPPHTLHGGFKAFDKRNWNSFRKGTKVTLTLLSKDGDDGFPGDVIVYATFELTNSNEFKIDYKAFVTRPTWVNLTNHAYFNLAGHDRGAEELYKHVVQINADQTTDVDKDSIPSGKLLPVSGTIFDLRAGKVLGNVIKRVPGYSGYDHNFCITKGSSQEEAFVAKVEHPPSGRIMEVYSNQPGVQFYTTNSVPEAPDLIIGKKGNVYHAHSALCLETQNFPDAANHSNFPKAIYNPGEAYHHTVTYKFFVNSD